MKKTENIEETEGPPSKQNTHNLHWLPAEYPKHLYYTDKKFDL